MCKSPVVSITHNLHVVGLHGFMFMFYLLLVSVKTAEDVSLLAPFCHGVNIKMEKAGGFRAIINGTT